MAGWKIVDGFIQNQLLARWWFPKVGQPPVLIQIFMGFSLINHPASWGYESYWVVLLIISLLSQNGHPSGSAFQSLMSAVSMLPVFGSCTLWVSLENIRGRITKNLDEFLSDPVSFPKFAVKPKASERINSMSSSWLRRWTNSQRRWSSQAGHFTPAHYGSSPWSMVRSRIHQTQFDGDIP